MKPDLAARYADERLPRYTSYPTAPQFGPAVGADRYAEWLAAVPDAAVGSLYVHIPFCAAICNYCNFNRGLLDDGLKARYVNALDARGRKPATLARRIASLGAIHRLMGLASPAAPTEAPMVRDALKAVRRRRGALQRQAAPLRLGKALDSHAAKGFTLTAMLDACGGDLQGLRDAALLSMG